MKSTEHKKRNSSAKVQTIPEYDDLDHIKEQTFKANKRITKKMVRDLLASQKKPFLIRRVKSEADLNQLIEEC